MAVAIFRFVAHSIRISLREDWMNSHSVICLHEIQNENSRISSVFYLLKKGDSSVPGKCTGVDVEDGR